MSCYEVNVYSVDFKNVNTELLEKVLKRLGHKYEIEKNRVMVDGVCDRVIIQDGQIKGANIKLINEIRREYSRQVVTQVAGIKRWAVRGNMKANKFQLVRN